MNERSIGVLMVFVCAFMLWWSCWRPGGPMNRHVWMSEQIKPLPPPPTPPKPATGSSAWGINYVDTYALNTPMQTIPMEIDIRHGSQWVSVKLDVCMKHGEWRVLP